MTEVATETRIERRVLIKPDNNDHGGSRSWDNLGVMYCFHTRYNLGDEQPAGRSAVWLREFAAELVDGDAEQIPDEHLKRILDKHALMMPLYLYDHSGLSISTSGFSCPWDSGQVGVIVCTLKKAIENWSMDPDSTWKSELPDWPDHSKTITLAQATERVLQGEVKTYDMDLTGQVYGYIIEQREVTTSPVTGARLTGSWEHVDSCWGFYGRDVEESGMIEHMPDEECEALLRAADISY